MKVIDVANGPVSQNTGRLVEAFHYAADLHAYEPRKGTSIPYISHLMAVAGTVIEQGGRTEDAIAALLHDAIEDHPRDGRTREEIRERFGVRVLALIEACSDADSHPKPPWPERKKRYIAHIPEASPEARVISLADKLHNARSILADYRQIGDCVWKRFNAPKEEQLWLYRALADKFLAVQPGFLADELDRTVTELERLAAP